MKGKVIGIIGSPGCGKTFLAKQLQKKLNSVVLYEETETSFPQEIQNNLGARKNLFETIVWFRNEQVSTALQANKIANEGKHVILDSTIYQSQLYIELYIKKLFQKTILNNLHTNDKLVFPLPDILIYISASQSEILEFLDKRSGLRVWEKNDWNLYLSRMAEIVEKYFKKNKDNYPNLIIIKRKDYDFNNPNDIKKLMSKIII
ncbi:MAG: deoxynucleoside kinase [Ferruginibacter sp.]